MRVSGKEKRKLKVSPLLLALLLVTAAFLVAPAHKTYAFTQIINRSLTLQAGATDGGSKPGGVVNHFFQFTIPDTPSIGSILFQYCTTAEDAGGATCVMPNGLSTTAATYDETGSAATGFSLVKTTNGEPYITRTAAAVPANSVMKFKLLNVTNPDGTSCTSVNCTFFVRISVYSQTNPLTGTPTPLDAGTVAAATATQIQLSGIMPESLIFCTGGTITNNAGGVPDCTTATSGSIQFNQLFSPTATAHATSQLAASTNALSGYSITVSGPTLTSGSNTIRPIGATAAASTIGTAQFGLNLVKNTDFCGTGCNVGANVAPASNGTNYMGAAATNFNTGGSFAFNASAVNTVAASDNGTGTGAPTDTQTYTASYIVNVSGSQPAGTYSTTLTYICTPTF